MGQLTVAAGHWLVPVPNKPHGFCGRKATLNQLVGQLMFSACTTMGQLTDTAGHLFILSL